MPQFVSWTCRKINCEYVVRDRAGRVKATGRTARQAVVRALAEAAKQRVRVRVVSGDRIVEPAAQGISEFAESVNSVPCESCHGVGKIPEPDGTLRKCLDCRGVGSVPC